jgi:hypothetical protein
MLTIRGEDSVDYFVILCDACSEETENEYLGWDPGVPHFRATCRRCGESKTLKLTVGRWKGLPKMLDPD